MNGDSAPIYGGNAVIHGSKTDDFLGGAGTVLARCTALNTHADPSCYHPRCYDATFLGLTRCYRTEALVLTECYDATPQRPEPQPLPHYVRGGEKCRFRAQPGATLVTMARNQKELTAVSVRLVPGLQLISQSAESADCAAIHADEADSFGVYAAINGGSLLSFALT
eukprot:2971394-Rhodomonas_salina.1